MFQNIFKQLKSNRWGKLLIVGVRGKHSFCKKANGSVLHSRVNFYKKNKLLLR